MTLAEAIGKLTETLIPIYGTGEAKSLTKIVAEDVFGTSNIEHKRKLSETDINYFFYLQNQLLSGRPLQYVLGKADFYGYKFHVNENVLIPRQDTEELVYLILETLSKSESLSGLDIGTGSGCISIVLKKKRPHWNIHALDVSKEALIIAKKNARDLVVEIDFFQFDILNKKDRQGLPVFDFIVSNPPYIPQKEKKIVPGFVKNFEPGLALFVADHNPLIFYKTITEFAIHHLNPGGYLFFETNEFNADKVVDLLKKNDFSEIELVKDMNGKNRMVMGALRR